MAAPALFIYGSLLSGSGLPAVDGLLSRFGRSLGPAVMRGRLYLLDGYPGAVPSCRRQDRVFGRVVLLRSVARVMRRLDAYEGVRRERPARGEFVRARTVVTLQASSRPMAVWVYLYNGSVRNRRRIRGGDYLAHLRHAASLCPVG